MSEIIASTRTYPRPRLRDEWQQMWLNAPAADKDAITKAFIEWLNGRMNQLRPR